MNEHMSPRTIPAGGVYPQAAIPAVRNLNLTRRGLELVVGDKDGIDPHIIATFMYCVAPDQLEKIDEAAFVKLIEDFGKGAAKLLGLQIEGDTK